MSAKTRERIFVAGFLSAIFFISLASVWHKTSTYDEGGHYYYGSRVLELRPDRHGTYDDSKMPVSALNVIPHWLRPKLEPLLLSARPVDFLEPGFYWARAVRWVKFLLPPRPFAGFAESLRTPSRMLEPSPFLSWVSKMIHGAAPSPTVSKTPRAPGLVAKEPSRSKLLDAVSIAWRLWIAPSLKEVFFPGCLRRLLVTVIGTLKSSDILDFLDGLLARRAVTVLFSMLTGWVVFKWSKKLYGFAAGVFAALIYSLEPNVIAHAQLVTTDLYAACGVTLSLYYFWKFMRFGGFRNAFLSALTLGLAQLAKFHCLTLFPIFALILALLFVRQGLHPRAWFSFIWSFLKYVWVYILVVLFVMNAGFVFNKSFMPLKKYEFQSKLFQTLRAKLKDYRDWPVPLPYPYLQGVDMCRAHEETGGSYGNLYLLGKLQEKRPGVYEGFKGYYFYACLFKVPIAIQVIFWLALFHYLARRRQYRFFENEMFLLVPIVFFSVYFNFFYKAQIGLRHFLLVFPIAHVFCGSLFKNWKAFGFKSKLFFAALMVYLAASTLSYYPHFLSYFNEFIPDRRQAYKILADSNIDWGQNWWYFGEYQKKHPGLRVDPPGPVTGRIAVQVNELVGVWDPGRYRWLRENYEPVDHVAYSYLVYDVRDVSEESLKKIRR